MSSLASMNENSTTLPDIQELQNTLNTSKSNLNLDSLFKHSTSTSSSTSDDKQPTRPSNTLFWLDDVLAKIDLMQNRDEKLGALLIGLTGNITLPVKPHCGNFNN